MTRLFERHIDHIKSEILFVGALVEEALAKAIRALFDRNRALAQQVIRHDVEIDGREVELEEECINVLALFQPVAVDLRFIVTVLKVNADLERIGDLAESIARQVDFLAARDDLPLPSELQDMSVQVKSMVKRSLDALVERDASLAREVCQDDNAVNALLRQLHERIPDQIVARPHEVRAYLKIDSIAKTLERIGDMATNISENVIYMVEGELARHRH